MLPSILSPFLPIMWALIASAFWWRQLSSPWLFLVTGLFALFGIQAIVSFLWDYWPSIGGGGHFLEANNFVAGKAVTEAEIQRHLEEKSCIAITQAFIVLAIAPPFLWWLKKRAIAQMTATPNNPVNRTAEHAPLGCLYPFRAASGYFHRWASS